MANQLPAFASKQSWRCALVILFCGVVAFVTYTLTCYPTVTWWDSTPYTTAAIALGVPGPPGSLVVVLIGWLVAQLAPLGSQALALNVTAAFVAALTVVVFSIVVRRLIVDSATSEVSRSDCELTRALSIPIAALTLAFSTTLWLHATKYTPYIFTVCLTVTILWALVRWWHAGPDDNGIRWLCLIALLIGLDFSVHRTNAVLVPGIFVFVLLRRPAVAKSLGVWFGTALALGIGLSFHLITMAIAAREPLVNFNDPSTFGRFWDYLSLQMQGGGWLVNLYPRNAPFWSYQIPDFLRVFSANFFSSSGPLSVFGLLPGAFGCLGIVVMLRRRFRFALALLLLVVVTATTTIVYFNIPANFFRPFDRHYLPTLVMFAAFIGYGVYVFLTWLRSLTLLRAWPTWAVAIVLLLTVPGSQMARNYRALDGHRNYFAYDFGNNILASLPPNAIIFTYGDSDTFLPWYSQIGEHARPDVTVLNASLLNTPWYVEQIIGRDTNLPLTVSPEELADLRPQRWSDTTLAVPVTATAADFNLPGTTRVDDTVLLKVVPQIEGGIMLVQDWLMLRLVAQNQFVRPVYFSMGGYSMVPPWFQSRLRPEGLALRLMPVVEPAIDRQILEENLLHKYSFRGFADAEVAIDETTQSMVGMYLTALLQLVQTARQECSADSLHAIQARIRELMPPERLTAPDPRSQQMVAEIFRP